MKAKLTICAVVFASFSSSQLHAAVMELGWETDGVGNPLQAGTVVDNEYASIGLLISAINATVTHPSKALIFNSALPTGGDTDLRTPNPALHPSNTVAYGNILILSENDKDANMNGLVDDPDDEGNRPAGSLIFKMSFLQNQASFVFIDIEEAGGQIAFFLAGMQVDSVPIPATADGAVQTVNRPAGGNFDEFHVNLAGSGAIGKISLVPEPSSLMLLALGAGLMVRRRARR